MKTALLRTLAGPGRFLARLWLAGRYCRRLNYPWRQAWLKAERT